MTILEVTAAPIGVPGSGGGERHPFEFARELSRSESVVAAYASPVAHPQFSATELLVPAQFVTIPPFVGGTNPLPRTSTFAAIGSYLRSHRREIEFVHLHNLRTAMSTVWMFLTYLQKKDAGIRILLTDHGARFFPFPRLTASMADYFVPISHYSEGLLLQLARRPSCVVQTGVSPQFLAGAIRPYSERPIDLLFVGRMVPWKRPDRVLELAASVGRRSGRPVQTVLAGATVDPEFLTELRHRADRLGILMNVRFVAGPSDPELIELYSSAKLYCLASDAVDTHGHRHPYPELSSATVLEAAARGTPSLAHRIPATLEQVEDGQTGRLVDPFGGPETVDLAEQLLTDATAWTRLSAGARAFVERERTYPASVAVFRSFLAQIREGAA